MLLSELFREQVGQVGGSEGPPVELGDDPEADPDPFAELPAALRKEGLDGATQ